MKKKELIISSIIACVSAILFVVIALVVFLNNGETAMDNSVRDTVYSIRGNQGGFINYLFRIITEFGYLYVAIVIGLIGIVYTGFDRGLILYVIGFAIQATLNIVFKSMFDRERPIVANRWMKDDESSFPSGHSATVAFVYPYITYYMFKMKKAKWLKYTSLGVTIVMIPLVMLSRLILGMHYFTDTIAGMSIGLFSCAVTVMLYLLFEKYDLFTNRLINFNINFKRKKKNEETTND